MGFEIKEKIDLWQRLCDCKKPIILYGMGDGADKIISVLESKNLSVSDFFASDEFVRGQSFHNKTVLRFSDITAKYSDFCVLVAFASSLPDVMRKIRDISKTCELYMPDVPVVPDGTLFDMQYVNDNFENLSTAYDLLGDEESRRVFDNLVNFKISGKIEYLDAIMSDEDDAFENILHPENYSVCADLGAYTGDSAKKLICRCKNISKIYAFEPDRKNFAKLEAFAKSVKTPKILPENIGAYSESCEEYISEGAGRGSRISKDRPKTLCKFDALDNVIKEDVDFIKYDVEGAEHRALVGARNTIRRCVPEMLISLYHRNEDLFDLILLVYKIMPWYKLYLRKHTSFPAWDINLYCVKERNQNENN